MKEQDRLEYEKRFERESDIDGGLVIRGIAIIIGVCTLVLMNMYM